MKEHFAPRAEWTKEGGEARHRGRRGLVRGSKTDRSRWASVGRWAGLELGNPKGLSAGTVA
jgi:hypothetical protein